MSMSAFIFNSLINRFFSIFFFNRARQCFMVKEKRVIVYGQQKATKESNKQIVKSFVRLRIQNRNAE